MGSAKISTAKPQPPMAEEKRSIKRFFKNIIFRKDKNRDKQKNVVVEEKQKPIAEKTIENILEKLKKVEIEDDDELKNFTIRTVTDDERTLSSCSDFKTERDSAIADLKGEERDGRTESHSSEDSGFSEKCEIESDDEKDDVIQGLKNLALDEGKCKEKRLRTVSVSRGPIRNKVTEKGFAPYSLPTEPATQIQINKLSLTGGQCIINPITDPAENFPGTSFVDSSADSQALDNVLEALCQRNSQNNSELGWSRQLDLISEYIQEVSSTPPSFDGLGDSAETSEDILSVFRLQSELQSAILTPPHQIPELTPEPNPIEEFSNNLTHENFDIDLTTLEVDGIEENPNETHIFPTPPHSENAASPLSEQSMYRTSDYSYSPGHSTLSPERSSPIYNSDLEKFQDIPHYEDLSVPSAPPNEEKTRQRSNSTSSMTMKMYKDMQKDISRYFSEKECCQMTRKSCKEIFTEHLQKLSAEERRGICFKVAKMDLKYAYGVLQRTMIELSKGTDSEDLHLCLFCLICDRVLAQQPAWYVEDFGLNLLKSAVLRCSARPLLTRFLVQCVRAAIKHNPTLVQDKESVFHEVDGRGDTLVTACARRGDACADVLAELVAGADRPPLFKLGHVNADGASALHVACSEHSGSSPRLHVVHVLLDHARADIWQGDGKAGDTAVHMAVNSKSCDLKLVLLIFRSLDRKEWKKLAHAPNMCSTTPMTYARSAQNSQGRAGSSGVDEVVDFLKRCR